MFDGLSKYRTQIITAIPLICVNTVAVSGQYSYLSDHIDWPTIGLIIFAAALESTALYLAYMAHKALLSLDSSLRLRIGAIGFGALAGYMNATHYESHGHLTFLSYATGLMSLSSPILWGIYSRRVSRDALMERGLIEPGAIRLGANRWFWYPRRSIRVYRSAAWTGERNAKDAISAWEATQISDTEPETVSEPEPVIIPEIPDTDTLAIEPPDRDTVNDSETELTAASKSDAIRAAFQALGEDASGAAVAQWLAARGWPVTGSLVRQVKARIKSDNVARQRDTMRAIDGARK